MTFQVQGTKDNAWGQQARASKQQWKGKHGNSFTIILVCDFHRFLLTESDGSLRAVRGDFARVDAAFYSHRTLTTRRWSSTVRMPVRARVAFWAAGMERTARTWSRQARIGESRKQEPLKHHGQMQDHKAPQRQDR